jgi:hypothetical protein
MIRNDVDGKRTRNLTSNVVHSWDLCLVIGMIAVVLDLGQSAMSSRWEMLAMRCRRCTLDGIVSAIEL